MVLVPAELQVAAVVFIVGADGVTNIAALLKDALDAELQLPLLEITVYEVPTVIPDINPPTPTVGPLGVNT